MPATLFERATRRTGLTAILFVACGLILGAAPAWAQQSAMVTGTVTAEDGTPLSAASVEISELRIAVGTNRDGNYRIEVPASRVQGQDVEITASALGYRTVTLTVTLTGGTVRRDFALMLDPIGLSEIVVTGQGTERRRQELGRTVATVNSDEIEQSQELNLVSALAGKAPNVQVTTSTGDPGGGAYMNIRGYKTLSGDNQPLFVVDGTPINNTSVSIEGALEGAAGTQDDANQVDGTAVQNRVADINPDDIESVEILPGPAASAIYGSAGANGVVLITTKSGRAGTTQAILKSSYSFDDVNTFNDLQTRFRQGFDGAPLGDPGTNSPGIQSWGTPIGEDEAVYDHGDELFRTGNRWNSNLSISGGNDQTTYFLSGGYTNHEGPVDGNSQNERVSVRLKGSHGLLDNLTVTGNVAYTNQASDLIQQGSNTSGLLLAGFRTPPEFNNLPLFHPETGLHRSYTNPNPASVTEGRIFDNPFWVAREIRNTADVNRTFGNIRLDYDPFSWITVSNTFGADFANDDRLTLFPKSSATVVQGRLIRASISTLDLDNTLLVTGTHDFSENFGGSLSLGQNLRQQKFERLQTQGDQLIEGGTDLESTVTRIPTEYESRVRTEGYFAEANADLYDQLFLTAGVRYDGFSTFGRDQQRFWFPNANAAWEFTQLSSFEDVSWLDYGKVRVAYGEAGEDPPVFSNVSTFQTTTFSDGWITPFGLQSIYNGFEGVVTEFTRGNENIDPERTKEWEAGLDLAFLDSRLAVGATFYDQQTEDAIVNLQVAPSTGAFSRPVNGAEFSNRGFELTLDAVPVQSDDFRWELNGQWATNDSEVQNILGAENFLLSGFTGTSTRVVRDQCGVTADQVCPFGVLFGDDYVRFGRGSRQDVDGDGDLENIDEAFPGTAPGTVYIGSNGFPVSDGQQRVLGDPNPDWTASVRNTFTLFRNFRLSGLIDVSQGGDMWNGTKGALFFYGTHAETVPLHGEGQPWVFEGEGPGAGTEVMRNWATWTIGGPGSGFTGGTPLFIEDRSFVKLRDVSASYTFNAPWVRQKLGFDRMELKVIGRNLVTWTDYTGLDPESNLTGQTAGQGLEYFNNPRTRSWIVQLTVVR